MITDLRMRIVRGRAFIKHGGKEAIVRETIDAFAQYFVEKPGEKTNTKMDGDIGAY
jgi:hypothetical protein